MTLWKFVRTSTKHKLDNDELNFEDANGSLPPQLDNGNNNNNNNNGGRMRARDSYVSSNRCFFFLILYSLLTVVLQSLLLPPQRTATLWRHPHHQHHLHHLQQHWQPHERGTNDKGRGRRWWGLGLKTVTSQALSTFFSFLCTILTTVHRFSDYGT